jgi:hypothetical protein
MTSDDRRRAPGTGHEAARPVRRGLCLLPSARRLLPVAVCLVPLLACGEGRTARAEHPAAGLSDSVLAKSRLPGATGVGAALKLQESAAARRAHEDSLIPDP